MTRVWVVYNFLSFSFLFESGLHQFSFSFPPSVWVSHTHTHTHTHTHARTRMHTHHNSCSCFRPLYVSPWVMNEVTASPTARSTDDLQCCKRPGTAVQAQGKFEMEPPAVLCPETLPDTGKKKKSMLASVWHWCWSFYAWLDQKN